MNAREESLREGPQSKSKQRVVVAMSGGVDSSAAAVLLAEQGYDVVGVSMQVWDYRKNRGNAKKATCCAPADFDDARRVAAASNIPFYVFDFEESFFDAVISPFVQSYVEGYTPNPCLECNRKVKFRELRNRARALGTPLVATGHYAQIREKVDGSFGLYTGADESKDQSYFLYALTQEDLAHTLFPVGAMTKPAVRQLLAEHGHEMAQKPESQDICFVASSVPEFVELHLSKRPPAGEIVTRSGEVVGHHLGIHHYTVGQRKGLGGGQQEPLFVLEIDRERNRIVVGQKSELERQCFLIRDVNWINGSVPSEPIEARVKLRYRSPGLRCQLRSVNRTKVEAQFLDRWTAVSPGQAAVFYALEPEADGAVEVLGGGIIEKDECTR